MGPGDLHKHVDLFWAIDQPLDFQDWQPIELFAHDLTRDGPLRGRRGVLSCLLPCDCPPSLCCAMLSFLSEAHTLEVEERHPVDECIESFFWAASEQVFAMNGFAQRSLDGACGAVLVWPACSLVQGRRDGLSSIWSSPLAACHRVIHGWTGLVRARQNGIPKVWMRDEMETMDQMETMDEMEWWMRWKERQRQGRGKSGVRRGKRRER